MRLPNIGAHRVENALQNIDILVLEATAKIARGGGVRNATRTAFSLQTVGVTLKDTVTGSPGRLTTYNLGIAPGVLYFLRQNLAIGLNINGSYTKSENLINLDASAGTLLSPQIASSISWGVAVTPKIGYNVYLADVLSFFPVLEISYSETWSHSGAIEAELYAPVLLHVASHMYIGMGPALNQQIYCWTGPSSTSLAVLKGLTTSFGVATTIGAYF